MASAVEHDIATYAGGIEKVEFLFSAGVVSNIKFTGTKESGRGGC